MTYEVIVKSAIKIKINVHDNQDKILDGQSKILNWAYNQLLEEANKTRRMLAEECAKESAEINIVKILASKLYYLRSYRDMLPGMKIQYPFLKTVYSSPLKNAALRLGNAIKDYKNGRDGDRKNKPGWPTFRSWGASFFSLEYEEPFKGYSIDGRKLLLSLGKVVDENSQITNKQLTVDLELAESLPRNFDPSTVRTMSITKEHNQFYMVLVVNRTISIAPKPMTKILAIDPNHKNLGYGIDQEGNIIKICNPWFTKEIDKVIDTLKSRRDKCEKKSIEKTRVDGTKYWIPSRRWSMFNCLLQEAYRKRRDQIKVYLYTIANKLFSQYDIISVGDYTPRGGGINKGMRRAMNNQSMIGTFKKILEWVAVRSGKKYMEWKETGSTRTCSRCNYVVKDGLKPNIRQWECSSCNEKHIRDENAAQNGLMWTLKKLELPCSGRQEITSRRAWRFNGLGVVPGIIDEQKDNFLCC